MIIFIKRFVEWIGLKERLDTVSNTPPLFNEGEIWWCAMGENIGTEISGKNKSFSRPVVVLKKYGRLSFFGLPLTTKAKQGSWFVPIKQEGKESVAVVSQGRYIDYRRLYKKIGTLDDIDFARVKESFLAQFI